MKLTTNSAVTHEFFYASESTNYTFGTQCYFDFDNYYDSNIKTNFYSYYTKIAMLYESKKTNKIYLLMHWGSMTPTTGKHLAKLRYANPHYDIIYVPFEYGSHNTSLNNIIDICINYLKNIDKNNIIDSKNLFLDYYKALNNINEFIIDLNAYQKDILKRAEKLANYINSEQFINDKKEAAKQKAAKTRAKNKARKEQEEKIIKEYTNNYNYIDIINMIYNRKYDKYINDYETRNLLIKKYLKLQDTNIYCNSVIWFDGDFCKTSKGVEVSKDEVLTLLKLWKHNKLKHGILVNNKYTVMSVTDKEIKVGCHIIPIENLQALCKAENIN